MFDTMSYVGGLLFFIGLGSVSVMLIISMLQRKPEQNDPNWEWTDFE